MKFKDLLKVGVSTLALLAGVVSASEDAVVTGVIVDSAGAPVRGALVQVTNGSRSISRFTDAKGTYRISGLPETTLQVTASRLGFKSQTIDARTPTNGASNFRLEERFDRLQLSDAELLTHLPQNSEVEWLKARCITCHGLTDLERFRGVPEEAWLAMLKSMEFSYGTESLTADDDAYAVKLLMKYFGPDAPVPTAQTVRRTTLSDAALNATYYVIDLRRSGGRSYPHSIAADNQGAAWLSEAGPANRITKWTVSTGQLEEIPMKLPDSAPHTPKIDLKGRVWTALQRAGQQSVIDPKTHKIDYIPLDMKLPTR
ncbi:MAG: carboxypeptidase regulatory-like domain-containing protein [Proteobacteria bacterium]|nr:carboxypeptidase regulatory-like domain-containing protein [Pseudomonadota bacterium]